MVPPYNFLKRSSTSADVPQAQQQSKLQNSTVPLTQGESSSAKSPCLELEELGENSFGQARCAVHNLNTVCLRFAPESGRSPGSLVLYWALVQ